MTSNPPRTPSIPGVKSLELLNAQREYESNAVTYPRHLPIAIKSARGSYIIDEDNNTYIDCLTGAGVLSLGHNHPEVNRAIISQLDTLCHGLDFPTKIKNEFTLKHLSMLPDGMRGKMKMHFCGPTGSDAVEAALKLSKINTGADEIISFRGAYHGCSHATMSVGSDTAMKSLIYNRVPGVHFLPFGTTSEFTKQTYGADDASAFFENTLNDPKSGIGKIAAVIVEIVQGEGGVNVASYDFIQKVRSVTREKNIPLIVDEIQTGCGRTGTWYAFEQYNIEPDIIITSKGISGAGLPVSIMIYDRKLDKWPAGAHIGTFRGNQLAFAASCQTIDIFRRDNILQNVRSISERIQQSLDQYMREFDFVADIRGLGLMIGIEIINPQSRKPDHSIAYHIQKTALQNGLILELGGRHDNVIRLLPPLNISEETADQSLRIMYKTFTEISKNVQKIIYDSTLSFSI
jgi:diaminobutyrate-2-oxoglutarate transaminase